MSSPPSKPPPDKANREVRLAQALRANLRRRKTAASTPSAAPVKNK